MGCKAMDAQKRFDLLANIMRASHFEWRRAALALCPDLDPIALVKRYWQEVGKDTAQYYLKKIDTARDLPAQVAARDVARSVAMGEDAEGVTPATPGESHARHAACPWFEWHARQGLLAEDLAGCDQWLQTIVDEINGALGSRLRFETVEALPTGGGCCLRRFWEDDK